uniref:Beta-mannosidase n=1 Tax=Macrostomum lignano TaxID=282301 RepID=A0A1I8HIH9_9PLAT
LNFLLLHVQVKFAASSRSTSTPYISWLPTPLDVLLLEVVLTSYYNLPVMKMEILGFPAANYCPELPIESYTKSMSGQSLLINFSRAAYLTEITLANFDSQVDKFFVNYRDTRGVNASRLKIPWHETDHVFDSPSPTAKFNLPVLIAPIELWLQFNSTATVSKDDLTSIRGCQLT